MIWPAEKPLLARTKNALLDPIGYGTQKADANGAAEGFKNSILPFLKHKFLDDGVEKITKTKISIIVTVVANVLKPCAACLGLPRCNKHPIPCNRFLCA